MKKTIGILGGMGPLATADLFRKIVLMTKAGCDNEHLRIYIDNNANIPDRTGAILQGGKDPVEEMSSALRNLEQCGADCIIMPCNTAHYFLPRLQEQTSVPFISMLAETAKSCAKMFPGKTAGIMTALDKSISALHTATCVAATRATPRTLPINISNGFTVETITSKMRDDFSSITLCITIEPYIARKK